MGDALAQQVLGGFERVLQHGAVFDDAVGACRAFIHHKAAADRVVLAAADLNAGGIQSPENHAVGVVGQGFANHRQVRFFDEIDGVFAQQVQAPAAANRGQSLGHGFGVDGVRVLAFKPQQNGLVAAVAFAGGAEGAIEFNFYAGCGLQQLITAQTFGKTRSSTHGADGVGTGGADANLEQVEHA